MASYHGSESRPSDGEVLSIIKSFVCQRIEEVQGDWLGEKYVPPGLPEPEKHAAKREAYWRWSYIRERAVEIINAAKTGENAHA
jgi:hypothetical protein